jgi:hypothetical protein
MSGPSTLGVLVCDQMRYDRDTNKPILVGVFSRMRCSEFPSPIRPFDVHVAITNGRGRVVLDVVITRLSTEDQIAAVSVEYGFTDPLAIIHFRSRFRMVSFPAPGVYLVEVFADGNVIGHTRLEVLEMETPDEQAPS